MGPYYTDGLVACSKRVHVLANGVILARPLSVWCLRAAWVTLPLSAGPAGSAALRSWSEAPRNACAALFWLAWAAGLLACLAPRPQTLTALRVIAPTFFVLAWVIAFDGTPSAIATAGAIVATAICAGLASGHDIAIAAANSIAYGDEQRFPLRVPPALFLGPLPLARALVVAGVATPVLALADGKIVLGLVSVVVGAGLVFLLGRSLYGLSRRWAVLVPAGFVVVDPLTLADPVLFLREKVRSITSVPPGATPEPVLDLRLGATLGSVVVRFDEAADIVRAARARRGGDTVHSEAICVAVVRRHELLAQAERRRLPVS
jgi:hypothetical protein